jgi:4-amino-4-deoxy-L-arabinose transferase-like glycosyltransferase
LNKIKTFLVSFKVWINPFKGKVSTNMHRDPLRQDFEAPESNPRQTVEGQDQNNPKNPSENQKPRVDPIELSVLPREEITAPPEPGSKKDYFPLIELDFRFHINLPLFQPQKTRIKEGQKVKQGLAKLKIPVIFTRDPFIKVKESFTTNPQVGLILLVSAIALALFGVYGLIYKEILSPYIWSLLAGAVLFFFYSMVYGFTMPFKALDKLEPDNLIPSVKIQQWMLFFAIIISLISVFLLDNHAGDQPFWDIFSLWVISLLLCVLAYLPKIHFHQPRLAIKSTLKSSFPIIIVLAVGIILRFYQLGSVPYIMENDEGMVGIKAVSVLTGELKSMFETFGGYGTLHFFIMAIPVKLFGQTLFSIRLMTAIYGVISLFMIYLLAEKMFDRRVALVSTALLAVSHLHIQFSRVSPSASSLDPMLTTLALLLIFKGFQTRRSFDWACSGLVIGLGLYFYVGARVMFFIVAGFLILSVVFQRKSLWDNRKNIGVLVLVLLITAAPMILWAINHPDVFNARVNQVGIFQNGWVEANIAKTGDSIPKILLLQLRDSFLMFFYSHPEWFYQALVPALGPITAIAFAFGLLVCMTKVRESRYSLIFSWFWVTLITGQVLQVDPQPAAYRTLGIMPAVCMIAAIALVRIADGIFAQWPKIQKFAPVTLITMILILEGGWNVWNYFGVWGQEYAYGDSISRMQSLIGEYVGKQPEGTQVYIASSSSYWVAGSQTFDYQRKSTPFGEVDLPMADLIPYLHLNHKAVFIIPPDRGTEISVLKQAFPKGRMVPKYLGSSLYFTAFEVDTGYPSY